MKTELSQSQNASQEFINVCYAGSSEKGERVDYAYPYGLKNGQQTIYLDIQGEILLDQAEFDKMISTDIGLDTPYGAALHQSQIDSRYFQKTDGGVKFAFPTCWNTPIPGGKLAGHGLCDLTVAITFQCKDSSDDYIVQISSQGRVRKNPGGRRILRRVMAAGRTGV